MRNEQIKELFKAYFQNNDSKMRKLIDEIIEDEEQKKHKLLADELRQIVSDSSSKKGRINTHINPKMRWGVPIPRDDSKGFPLLEIQQVKRSVSDIILDIELKNDIERIIAEYRGAEILGTYGLKPRQKLIFYGEPGTGKTLASYVISSALHMPLCHIRFDSIISSYLGETATNLRKVFDFIETGDWVVLFDEFDFIAKKRDDPYEHGEVKRVVNNFMQMLDSYNGTSLIIAATNHQYLLDVGVWRRFDDALFFKMPDVHIRTLIFKKYLEPLLKQNDVISNSSVDDYASLTDGFSPSDIQMVCENALRRVIVDKRFELSKEDVLTSISHHKLRKEIVRRSRCDD